MSTGDDDDLEDELFGGDVHACAPSYLSSVRGSGRAGSHSSEADQSHGGLIFDIPEAPTNAVLIPSAPVINSDVEDSAVGVFTDHSTVAGIPEAPDSSVLYLPEVPGYYTPPPPSSRPSLPPSTNDAIHRAVSAIDATIPTSAAFSAPQAPGAIDSQCDCNGDGDGSIATYVPTAPAAIPSVEASDAAPVVAHRVSPDPIVVESVAVEEVSDVFVYDPQAPLDMLP